MPSPGLDETTPLLPEAGGSIRSPETGEPAIGPLPPAGPENGLVNGQSNGAAKAGDEEENPEAVNGARENQFEGMPEVMAQMKYILPAVSIGVRTISRDGAGTR